MSDNAIEVRGLIKHFGAVHALDGLDLDVPAGQVTGFLGPNGSGKTTTIRILLGLIKADGGSAKLLGGNPWLEAVKLHKRVAYVPGDVALWPNLTGGQIIDVLGRLTGGLDPQRRKEMIERFQLDPSKKSGTYSKGNRQKVALVAALASHSELLLLDEPTSGLDPIMEAEFQKVIKDIKGQGRSVLLSSHIFAEVESLADTVTIIREGRTVEAGSLSDLRKLARTEVKVHTATPVAVQSIPGVHDVAIDGDEVSFTVDGADWPKVLQALSLVGITQMTANPPSLEQIFLSNYTEPAAEPGIVKALK